VELALRGGGDLREAGVPITAAIASGSGGLQGVTTAITDGHGRARFENLAIVGSGPHTLRFSAEGFEPAVSRRIQVE
jgi:hypothetical protein